jgi:hypothetical protein
MSFKVNIQKKNDEVCFIPNGDISENFSIEPIDFTGISKIRIDLCEVLLINSSGVKEWFRFIDDIPKEVSIIYSNTPTSFVYQMNSVEGFLTSNSQVESFWGPYFDESKDVEVRKLLHPSDVVGNKAPIFKNEAGEELEFDAIEEQFFKFLEKL